MFNNFRVHFLVHNHMVLNLDSSKTNTNNNKKNITPPPPPSTPPPCYPYKHTSIIDTPTNAIISSPTFHVMIVVQIIYHAHTHK